MNTKNFIVSWDAALKCLLFPVVGLLIHRLFLHPLSRIPGPLLAKLSGSWRNYRYCKGTWHDDILEVHRRYGPIVRIAPNELSVVDSEVTRRLYGHGHNALKTDWYDTWNAGSPSPIFFAERDKTMHSLLRKRVSGAYSMSAILKFEQYIQDCLDLMFHQLKKRADAGDSVDMADWTNAFAFDVVGELAYGSQLGHLRTESDVMGLQKGIADSFWIMANLGHFPGQARLITNRWMGKVLAWLGQADPIAEFREWSITRVQSRWDNPQFEERPDMLSHFVKMKNNRGENASFDEVLAEAMNIIGAGADTTSIAMRSCLYYICSAPHVYRKVQKEIDDYYEANALEQPITYHQTQQLPYTVATCKEAMRLLPSISYQLLRYAPEGLSVRGKHIPAGTPIGVSPRAQNRDQDVFGPDADDFRPERWFEEEQKTKLMDFINMTFGGNGPRMCIGRNIALVEVHKFIVQLLRNFDVGLVDRQKPWRLESKWFTFQYDMHMSIKARPHRTIRAPRSLNSDNDDCSAANTAKGHV